MDLALQLRQASHDLHSVAEKTGLMPQLLGGTLSRHHYTILLQNLQAIYKALEKGLDRSPGLKQFDWVPLYRSRAIAQDLVFLQPEAEDVLCEATLSYVARLEELGTTGSPLLLAHAYVRYLGDLHGGQLLRRCVSRLLQADGGEGLHFYDFGPPERVGQLIQAVRIGLNSQPLDTAQAEAVAQEARLGFAMHIDLFRQLPHASAGGVKRTDPPV